MAPLGVEKLPCYNDDHASKFQSCTQEWVLMLALDYQLGKASVQVRLYSCNCSLKYSTGCNWLVRKSPCKTLLGEAAPAGGSTALWAKLLRRRRPPPSRAKAVKLSGQLSIGCHRRRMLGLPGEGGRHARAGRGKRAWRMGSGGEGSSVGSVVLITSNFWYLLISSNFLLFFY